MSTTLIVYTHLAAQAFRNQLSDLNSPNTVLRMMLLGDGYSPDSHNHTTVLDANSYEIQGENYNAGGKQLENISLTTEEGVTTFEADNIGWPDSTLEFRYLVVYDDTPAAASDKNLLFYADFGQVIKTRNSEFAVKWDDEGIFNISVSMRSEILTSVPVFTQGVMSQFSISTVANDYEGTMVRAYFERPEYLESLQYQELNLGSPKYGEWLTLEGDAFGPSSGFPLTNTNSKFRASFSRPGTHTARFYFVDMETGKTLISQSLSFVVEAAETIVTFDVPEFSVQETSEFTISTIANENEGVMVRGYFDRPDELEILEYQEQDPTNPSYGQWLVLAGNAFGPETGFPLTNTTSIFRASFSVSGTFIIPISFVGVSTQNTLALGSIQFVVQ